MFKSQEENKYCFLVTPVYSRGTFPVVSVLSDTLNKKASAKGQLIVTTYNG